MSNPLCILVTGADGFVGKNLVLALQRRGGCEVMTIHRGTAVADRSTFLRRADFIYHLAGVNRPSDPRDFSTGNADFSRELCGELASNRRQPTILFASSVQAALDNPYGRSKRAAEEHISRWAAETGGRAIICRLKNIFGKWCRPNYNSVVATFCHNAARGLPLEISDPGRQLELVYIDDVVSGFINLLGSAPVLPANTIDQPDIGPAHRVTLGELARKITGFRQSRRTLALESFDDDFTRALYATYLSHLLPEDFAYPLTQRYDARGSLAEFIKQPAFGQIFVSRTAPGITRGNHYHDTKTEKFLVVEGQAVVRFRPALGGAVIEHAVSGTEFKVVDIPPGYTHSIENVGPGELVTLFWASEIFNPDRADTFPLTVLPSSPS